MSRKKKKGMPPPPPGPQEDYVLVETREGYHWRRKRGTIKQAKLNRAFQQSANNTKWASPAAKNIKEKLSEFLNRLDLSRCIANISGKLRKHYTKTGEINYTLLKDYEWQPYHHLGDTYRGSYSGYTKGNEFIFSIRTGKDVVKRKNKDIDGYFFDLILLYGDPTKKNSLRIETETSPVYTFNPGEQTTWTTSFTLPDKKPWMVILKLSSLENGKPAEHARHYGMRVVGVGM